MFQARKPSLNCQLGITLNCGSLVSNVCLILILRTMFRHFRRFVPAVESRLAVFRRDAAKSWRNLTKAWFERGFLSVVKEDGRRYYPPRLPCGRHQYSDADSDCKEKVPQHLACSACVIVLTRRADSSALRERAEKYRSTSRALVMAQSTPNRGP